MVRVAIRKRNEHTDANHVFITAHCLLLRLRNARPPNEKRIRQPTARMHRDLNRSRYDMFIGFRRYRELCNRKDC
jgi:hypothetical protein